MLKRGVDLQILLGRRTTRTLGIVIELKYTKSFDEMETARQKAFDQIQDRRYQEFLINDDRKDIHLYGITFCKNGVEQ